MISPRIRSLDLIRPLWAAAAAPLLLGGCAVGGGVGIGVPIVPGVSFGVGVGTGGFSVGVSAGHGPVGVGVGVNQHGQVLGSAGIGGGVDVGGGARVGAGVGASTVLRDPRVPAATRPGADAVGGAGDWRPVSGSRGY